MKKTKRIVEKGSIEVEATLLFPMAILCVIFLLYMSLLMYQKANLQAGLITTLVYYKNTLTDTYVIPNDEMSYVTNDTQSLASGNSYLVNGPLIPYRGIFGPTYDFKTPVKEYFNSVAGKMLFDEDVDIQIEHNNHFVSQQLLVTARQEVKLPVSLGILGLPDKVEITASAKVNVVNADNTIRNIDYAIDLVEDTKLGEWAEEFATRIADGYKQVKDFLGVKEEGQ